AHASALGPRRLISAADLAENHTELTDGIWSLLDLPGQHPPAGVLPPLYGSARVKVTHGFEQGDGHFRRGINYVDLGEGEQRERYYTTGRADGARLIGIRVSRGASGHGILHVATRRPGHYGNADDYALYRWTRQTSQLETDLVGVAYNTSLPDQLREAGFQ